MDKKAIFLGSFNPPHKGHLNCIQSVIDSNVMNQFGIDKIHIIPCWQNPNKPKQIPFIKRYQMVLFMFGDLIGQEIVCPDDIEETIKPEYTYQLISYLKSNQDEYIKDDFWWIITEETYMELIEGKWKESDWLLENNNFIIVYENEHNKFLWGGERCIRVKLKGNMNIHSTLLRDKVKNGESIEEYTSIEIEKYIKENNLYML